MSVEAVRKYLSEFGYEDKILEFGVSSATVELAAKALECEPARIAKTLSFEADGHAILIVAAGDMKISNPKFKTQFKRKSKMLSPEDTEALTGHRIGGICPFAVPESAEVYLDESLKRFDFVFPACGSKE